MSYPISIYVGTVNGSSTLVFDWCTKTDLPNNYRVLELQGQYYLIYDYRSAGTDGNAWSYDTPRTDTTAPALEPGKLKLKTTVGANPSTGIKTIAAEMRIVVASNNSVITNGGPKQFWDNSVAFNPPSGTTATWYTNFPTNNFVYLDFLPGLIGDNFLHGYAYKAQVRFLGKNASGLIVGASNWHNTQHILYVNTKGPVVTITDPKFTLNNNLNEITVEDKTSLTIKFSTSTDSEVRVKDDLAYPYGTSYFTTLNSKSVSASGTKHQVTIQNPDINNTNGVRFSLAARDNTYKNISPCGWGLFNYNILFKKKAVVVPTISITGQTTTPASGGYYDASGQFGFSGNHTNAAAVKIELWQNNAKKTEKVCTTTATTWSGTFSSVALTEGAILVKAIATSSTGAIKEALWNGYVLKKPVITMTSPTNNTTIASADITVSGTIVNSLGFIKDSVLNVYVYKLEGSTRTEVARKQARLTTFSDSWSISASGLSSGTYAIKAVAVNTINQEGFIENNITVSLVAPSVSVISPAANTYHKNTTIFASGSCDKATDVKVEVWQNQVKQSEVTASLSSTKTQWSATLSALQNGQVDIRAIAANSANNQKTLLWHKFFIDIEAPTVLLESVTGKDVGGNTKTFANAANIDVYDSRVTLISSGTDSLSGIKQYQLYVNNVLVDSIDKTAGQSSLTATSNITLSEGQNKIEIKYTDALGNFERFKIAGNSYFYITLVARNTAGPIVAIHTPANDSVLNYKNVVASGTCSDIDNVIKITVQVYKAGSTTPYLTLSNATIDNIIGTWSCLLPDLSEGGISLKVFGEDGLGKISEKTATTSFHVDTIGPVIKINQISPGLTTTTSNGSIVSSATDSGSGIVKYIAKLEDRFGNIKEIANMAISGYPSASENSTLLNLSPGKNIVHVFYYDRANNVSNVSRTITYNAPDLTPPIIEITPSDNAMLSSLPLTCYVKASDMESGLKSCTVDFYPLTTVPQITSATQYYRMGMLPLAMSSANLALPDTRVLRVYDDANGGSYMMAPSAQYFSGDFTVESWVYIYEPTYKHFLLCFGNDDGSDTIEIGLNYIDITNVHTLKPWLRITNQSNISNAAVAPTTLQSKQWAHLAFVLSGNQATVYLNAKAWFSSTMTRVPRAITRTKCYIGRGLTVGASSNGYFSNLRIWNVARSADQISQNISQGINSAAGLVASWRLNNASGGLVSDVSGNNLNATLTSAAIEEIKSDTRRWVLEVSTNPSQTLSHITLPNINIKQSSGVTIEFSILCQEKNTGGSMLLLSNAAQDKVLALNLFDGDRVSFYVKSGSSTKTISSTTALPLKQKLHIAATITSSGIITLYKNGEVWGSGTGILPSFLTGLAFLGKGLSSTMTTKVALYDFRLWGISRTQQGVRQYISAVPVAESDLQVYYRFSDGAGSQIKDYSSYGNHGNIVNNNYRWLQTPSEAPVDFFSTPIFIDPSISAFDPLAQSEQLYGSLFEQTVKLDTQAINLKSAETFSYDTIQSEHLLNGTHVVKVKAINGYDLQTTLYRTLIFDSTNNAFRVTNITPANGATSVDAKTTLIIDFSESVSLAVITNHINRTILVFEANTKLSVELDLAQLVLTQNNTRLTCQFISALQSNTKYQVKIRSDLPSTSGNTLKQDFISYFTVGDVLIDVFRVIKVSPFDGQTGVSLNTPLVIDFSHPVFLNIIISEVNQRIMVSEADTQFVVHLAIINSTLSNGNMKLTCPFMSQLKQSTRYKVSISAGLSSSSGTILAEDVVSYFTTEGDSNAQQYTVPVFHGMNGLSIPLSGSQGKYTNISLRQFLQSQVGTSNVGAIYWYNNITKKWVGDMLGTSVMKTFDWQDGVFVMFNLSSSANINFSGAIIDNGNTTVVLKKGFNLIAIPLSMQNINNIKSLLTYISNVTGQQTIVSYMCRRKKISNTQEELLGYTYISGQNNRDGFSFLLDRLGGDAIAIVAEKDTTVTIQGQAWQD